MLQLHVHLRQNKHQRQNGVPRVFHQAHFLSLYIYTTFERLERVSRADHDLIFCYEEWSPACKSTHKTEEKIPLRTFRHCMECFAPWLDYLCDRYVTLYKLLFGFGIDTEDIRREIFSRVLSLPMRRLTGLPLSVPKYTSMNLHQYRLRSPELIKKVELSTDAKKTKREIGIISGGMAFWQRKAEKPQYNYQNDNNNDNDNNNTAYLKQPRFPKAISHQKPHSMFLKASLGSSSGPPVLPGRTKEVVENNSIYSEWIRTTEIIACPICAETFREGEMTENTFCFHSFHGQRIEEWFKCSFQSPVCKKRLRKATYPIKQYFPTQNAADRERVIDKMTWCYCVVCKRGLRSAAITCRNAFRKTFPCGNAVCYECACTCGKASARGCEECSFRTTFYPHMYSTFEILERTTRVCDDVVYLCEEWLPGLERTAAMRNDDTQPFGYCAECFEPWLGHLRGQYEMLYKILFEIGIDVGEIRMEIFSRILSFPMRRMVGLPYRVIKNIPISVNQYIGFAPELATKIEPLSDVRGPKKNIERLSEFLKPPGSFKPSERQTTPIERKDPPTSHLPKETVSLLERLSADVERFKKIGRSKKISINK